MGSEMCIRDRKSIADVESTRLDPARVKINDLVAFQYSRGTRAGQERTVRIVGISEGEGHKVSAVEFDKKGKLIPILSDVPPKETMKRGDGAHSGNPAVRKAVAAGKWREGDSVAQNLMGVILGPRGNSHKALCASSRSKNAIFSRFSISSSLGTSPSAASPLC